MQIPKTTINLSATCSRPYFILYTYELNKQKKLKKKLGDVHMHIYIYKFYLFDDFNGKKKL